MNDETNTTVAGLDEDLSGIDTSMPKLKGVFDLKIEEAEDVTNPETGKVNWKLTLKTTADTTSVSGEKVAPGFPIYHNVSLTPTAKYTAEAIKKNCATVTQAAGVRTRSEVVGKVVRCTLDVQPAGSKDGRAYPESNRITKFHQIK